MKKTVLTLLTIISVAVMSSCGQKVINSLSDELRYNKWTYQNELSGISASLTFENENAAFTINNENESCIISGICIANDDSIVIIDNDKKKEYKFDYSLKGENVVLIYNGNEICFTKST